MSYILRSAAIVLSGYHFRPYSSPMMTVLSSLTRHRVEVERMLGTLFNQEYVDKLKEKEPLFKVALNLLKMKLHLEDIVKATELSADEVRRIAKENGLSVV